MHDWGEYGMSRGLPIPDGRPLDDLAVAQQGNAALVLEVNDLDRVEIMQQSEVMIETLVAWKERSVEAEVPLADAGGAVAAVACRAARNATRAMMPSAEM